MMTTRERNRSDFIYIRSFKAGPFYTQYLHLYSNRYNIECLQLVNYNNNNMNSWWFWLKLFEFQPLQLQYMVLQFNRLKMQLLHLILIMTNLSRQIPRIIIRCLNILSQKSRFMSSPLLQKVLQYIFSLCIIRWFR
jgi:hypothetical protein